MDSSETRKLSLGTISQAVTLIPDEQQRIERLESIFAAVRAGRIECSDYLVEVEGPQVLACCLAKRESSLPLVPDVHATITNQAASKFFTALRKCVAPSRTMILKGAANRIDTSIIGTCGWELESSVIFYRVPLGLLSHRTDPNVRRFTGTQTEHIPDNIDQLLREFEPTQQVESDLFVYFDADIPVAAAWCDLDAYGCSIDFSGVHLSERNRGFGRKLMAHILSEAKEHQHEFHMASTNISNGPMRAILTSLGGVESDRQNYFISI